MNNLILNYPLCPHPTFLSNMEEKYDIFCLGYLKWMFNKQLPLETSKMQFIFQKEHLLLQGSNKVKLKS